MKKKKVVIKIGTNLLTTSNGELDLNNLRSISYQISKEHDLKNYEFIIVTSGSITCGAEVLNMKPETVPEKQAAAAIGQVHLMKEYALFFKHKNISIGQILLTRDGLKDKDHQTNVINTIETLLSNGCIPIINENDSVGIEELKFGDNDELSALVASLISADQLIILTDIDGYFTKNPKDHPDATLIPEINDITQDMIDSAPGPESLRNRGGIRSKLLAARKAMESDILTVVANGRKASVIHDILTGKPEGTLFIKR